MWAASRDLFNLERDLVVYDLTSTHFEGSGPATRHAARCQLGRWPALSPTCPTGAELVQRIVAQVSLL